MQKTIGTKVVATIGMFFLGDPATDRRSQNFRIALELEGHFVDFHCGLPRSNATIEIPCGVTSLIRLKAQRGKKMFLEYDRKLRSSIRGHSYDAVLACDLYSLPAARQYKQTYPHCLLLYDARELYTQLPSVERRPLMRAIWKYIERNGLASTDLFIVTGPEDVVPLFKLHKFLPRTALVRNFPAWSNPSKTESTLRAKLNIPETDTVFIYVGGLSEGRGLQPFIEAIALCPNAHAAIIGFGAIEADLKALTKKLNLGDRVHFFGRVEAKEALQLCAGADVGISLIEPISKSYELGLPSKIFEYLMAELIVLSTPLKQVKDLLGDCESIVYTSDLSPEQLADQMTAAVEKSKNLPLRLSGRELAQKEFFFAHDVEKVLSYLAERLQQ